MPIKPILLSSTAAIALTTNALAGPGDAYVSVFGGLSTLSDSDFLHYQKDFASTDPDPEFVKRAFRHGKNPIYLTATSQYTGTTFSTTASGTITNTGVNLTNSLQLYPRFPTQYWIGFFSNSTHLTYNRQFSGEFESSGWVIGATLGVELGGGFRGELEAAYRRFDLNNSANVDFANYQHSRFRQDRVYRYYYNYNYSTPIHLSYTIFTWNGPSTSSLNYGQVSKSTTKDPVLNRTLHWYDRKDYFSATNLNATVEGELTAFSLMANLWYDFPIGDTGIVPFVGAGVGIANLTLDYRFRSLSQIAFKRAANTETRVLQTTVGTGSTLTQYYTTQSITPYTSTIKSVYLATAHKLDEAVFAYQFGAGLGYEFDSGMRLSAQYRYFATGDADMGPGGERSVQTNDFLIGISLPLGGRR